MGAIGYLYRRTLINRIKVALHKPVTYFYIVLILFYLTFMPFSLKVLAEEGGIDSPVGMAGVLTLFAFWLIPGNLIAYAKRKGLVYRSSDVHFLFPSPVSPKWVLLYAHVRTIPMLVLINLFVVICGAFMFHVPGWKLAIYFLFSMVVENVLECSVMLLLYGTERLNEGQRGWIIRAAYGLVGILFVIGVVMYFREGLSFQTVVHFLHSDAVQLVPVIGWYISVLHLLFAGATTVNIIGTACYICLLAAVVTAAVKMKCTGAFYEDAIKFAEDYEEVLANRRQGGTDKRLGKKQKYGKASVKWKRTGAGALFSRQLLEYRKSRFFIFDASTFFALAAGICIPWLYVREGGLGEFTPFVIPAVAAYLIFIFTTLGGKWAKELKSPYTYMIPDSAFSKLVNATAIQIIQSLVNGLLITVPGAVVMGMSPVTTVLCVLAYVALSANKLYALAVAEIVVGGTMGTFGKQLFQMLIQGIVITVAILGAVLGAMTGGIDLAYLIMDVFMILFTMVFMIIASLNFYKMETA